MSYPTKVSEIISEKDHPSIGINDQGHITFVNEIFTREYGWEKDELLNQPITAIIPHHLREAHQIGFSRFLTTETPRLLGKPLPLEVLLKDGRVKSAEHFILAEKEDGVWRIAALLKTVS